MKSLRYLPLLLISLFVLSACDSGDDNEDTLIVPTVSAPVELSANDPAVVANATQATTNFSSVLAASGGLAVDPANTTLNTRSTISAPGQAPVTATVSVLVNASGQPTNSALVTTGGQTMITTPASDRSLTLTDSKGNRLKIQFDSNNRYSTTTFTAGSGAGQFSAATATQYNTALSANRDFPATMVLSPGVTAAQFLTSLASSGKDAGVQFGGGGLLGALLGAGISAAIGWTIASGGSTP